MSSKPKAIKHSVSSIVAILLMLFPLMAQGQICDNFSDGDLHNNPTWTGDTADFRINSNGQLQLYSAGADTSQIALPYSMPSSDTVEWSFWLRLAFTPTANNYTIIALYADSADLLKASHHLSLAVSDPTSGNKQITVYQDDIPLYTFPYRPTLGNNRLRFCIRMINRQQLLFAVDTVGETGTANYVECGSAMLLETVPDEVYFSIYCCYTSSRAHLFYYDDIMINSDGCGNSGDDGQKPQTGEIVINEILFNPKSGGSDYVELYNRSGNNLSLSQIFLAAVKGDSIMRMHPIGTGVIQSHTLIVITTDADYVASQYSVPYPARLLQVPSMPSYNDASGSVVVAAADSTILDRFDYDAKMHSRLLRDVEGVSLERRSVERPTQDASNWYSAASTAGYGTPTGKNSQSQESLFIDNNFALSTTLFSPDGDGYNDLLNITYTLEQCDLAANISIYDRNGRLVRHLSRGQLLGCSGNIVWDGSDNSGRNCARGKYLIAIEAYNENGASQTWRRTVSLVRQ